jgi:hypothetical protein
MNVDDQGAADPSAAALPADVERHVDWLAERVHEAWVDERQAAGWRYGRHRDDGRREHPNLVRYRDLSEADRRLDRAVVIATLTGMMELGYRFEKDGK